MPQVNVTIAAKTYRIACGEGEEPHLESLAAGLDARVAEMRTSFGEIGDLRLHVMAALMLCDELGEARAKIAALEGTAATERDAAEAGAQERGAAERRMSDVVARTAERLERLARGLATS